MVDSAIRDVGTRLRVGYRKLGSQLLVERSEDNGKSWEVVEITHSFIGSVNGYSIVFDLPPQRSDPREEHQQTPTPVPSRPGNFLRSGRNDVDRKKVRGCTRWNGGN